MDEVMNICLHGIGKPEPFFFLKWGVPELMGVPASQVTGFYYDDILDREQMSLWETALHAMLSTWYGRKLKSLVPDPLDYLDDILVFFLSEDARHMIEYRLYAAVAKYKKVRLIGYSLGSIVAYWFLLRFPKLAGKVELVTLASPMGSSVLCNLVHSWLDRVTEAALVRPAVSGWRNVSSAMDPLSGTLWHYGCQPNDEAKIPFGKGVVHTDVPGYLKGYAQQFEAAPGPSSAA